MIISCPNCKKQFKINPGLIPAKGRDLKCGSCNYVWFFDKKNIPNIPIDKPTIPTKKKRKYKYLFIYLR